MGMGRNGNRLHGNGREWGCKKPSPGISSLYRTACALLLQVISNACSGNAAPVNMFVRLQRKGVGMEGRRRRSPRNVETTGREYLFAPAIFSPIFACRSLNFQNSMLSSLFTNKVLHIATEDFNKQQTHRPIPTHKG